MNANDSTTPVARWRRVLAFLRRPWCGGVALLGIVISAVLLPRSSPSPDVTGTYSTVSLALWGPGKPSYLLNDIQNFIEVRVDADHVLDPSDWSWDDFKAKTRDAKGPAYHLFYEHQFRESGLWAPWRRSDAWTIEEGFETTDESNRPSLLKARAAMVNHLRSLGEPLPHDFDQRNVLRHSLVWSGVAWNAATLFAAWVFIWSLSGVPAWWRDRRARIAATKQVCAGCGYSLAGLGDSAPCPECGRVAHHSTPGNSVEVKE